MRIFATLQRATKLYSQKRRLVRTERLLAALPSDVQKDIGWPTLQETRIGIPSRCRQ